MLQRARHTSSNKRQVQSSWSCHDVVALAATEGAGRSAGGVTAGYFVAPLHDRSLIDSCEGADDSTVRKEFSWRGRRRPTATATGAARSRSSSSKNAELAVISDQAGHLDVQLTGVR